MSEFLALPRQLQIRELLRFISITVSSAIFPFMAMYYVEYFGNLATGGLIITTQIAGFLATLYGGHLSDTWGRKKVVDIGSLLTVVGWSLTVFANIPNQILPEITFIGILIIEIGHQFYSPAYDAMTIDLTTEENRRFVYSLGYWLINIAVMLGAGIAGLFYDHYFFQLLIVLLMISIFCFIVAYFYFEETRPVDMAFSHGHGIVATMKNYSEVLVDKPFLIYTLGSIGTSVVWLQVDNFFSVNLKLHFQKLVILGQTISGAKMLSIAVFTNTFLIVFLMTTINRWTKSWPLLKQLVIGSIVCTIGMFFNISLTNFWPILIAMVVFTFGEMINVPASQVLRADMMNEEKIGSYSGFQAMTYPMASILAGGMVSLSHFTGKVGVQLVFLLLSLGGLLLVVRATHLRDIKE